jgi:branched-chain amino acid transport system permease protein
MSRVWWLCAVLLIIAFTGVAIGMISTYYVGLMTEIFVFALFVMSLDLLVGFVGLDSLGHAAFFGLGAYVAGLLSLAGYENIVFVFAAVIVTGALLGMVFGAIALRAVGPYFLIITLALGYLPAALAIRWRRLTGGDDGLVIPGRPTLAGISLDDPVNYFMFVSAILLLCVVLMAALGRSSFGYGLRGIKESPARMEALGYRIWLYRFTAFVIAAVFAAVAGALNAFYNTFVSPVDFGIERSFGGLVAVILGGAGTLIGPAIAAAVIMSLRHVVGAFTQHWALILGLFYIVVVLYAPRGLAFGLRTALSGFSK